MAQEKKDPEALCSQLFCLKERFPEPLEPSGLWRGLFLFFISFFSPICLLDLSLFYVSRVFK
jgi:hypothetical protein